MGVRVGAPNEDGAHIGPVASAAQYDKVQELIQSGIEDGATLLCGGVGRPAALPAELADGYYCRPTVFADATPEMAISRQEIFGPVLTLTPFDHEDEAVQIANDTHYGLTSYLHSADDERVRRVVRRLRAGMVEVNGARRSVGAPFGGVKGSGNGREGGVWGLREFLEVKAVAGWPRYSKT